MTCSSMTQTFSALASSSTTVRAKSVKASCTRVSPQLRRKATAAAAAAAATRLMMMTVVAKKMQQK